MQKVDSDASIRKQKDDLIDLNRTKKKKKSCSDENYAKREIPMQVLENEEIV